MTVVPFPVKKDSVEEAAAGFAESVAKKKVKAVVIVTLEDDVFRVRHGWEPDSLLVLELLALASALEHSKLKIHEELES
jgi:hypothetical protein